MGTKVQCKSYLRGYYPMNDLNDNSNICNWPLFYGDKSVCGPYQNGFFSTPSLETYPGGEKDAVKLTMLGHEATFKNQVYELHRLYRVQKDMMNEIKSKEFTESQMQGVGFLSANLSPSQIASENVQKCHFTSSNVASSSNRQSISGAEEIHSGNNRQFGPYQSPNGVIVKEFERSRKSRKMLDLQLPAEEYMHSDEDEQTHDKKMSDFLPNKNQTIESEKHNDKAGCSVLWKSNGFADLNEPIQLEETNASRCNDFTCHASFHGETRNSNPCSQPLSQLLDLSREISLNSSYGSNNAMQNNHDVEKSRNGLGMFSNVLEAGNSKDNDKSKLPLSSTSKPILGFLNVKDGRKDGPEKSPEVSFDKRLGGFSTSHLTNPCQVSPNLNLNKSWSRSVSLWEKQSCQTSTSVQRQPGLNFDTSVSTLHKSSNSVAQRNGFFQGSSSGLKDANVRYSSTSYDCPKFISNDNPSTEKIHEASNYFDMNYPVGINLNVVRSNSSSDGGSHHSAFRIKDGKSQSENHRSFIPWLKAMPSSMNGAENSSSLVNDGEISFVQSAVHRDKMENGDCPKKVFSDVVVGRTLESGSKKILGFAIFDESRISKNDSFSLTSPSGTNPRPPSELEREDGRKIRALDINLPCDPSVPDAETLKSHTVSSSRHQIDLNICLSDNEELFDIDLEAPAVPESTETNIVEEVEKFGDELVKMAAEAIVSIFSCKNLNEEEAEEGSPRGSLPWFVDIVLNDESTTEWIDHFEAMTLSLKETTEEEYMPKPPFPSDKFKESANFSQTRLRRAQSRRGRQRRAFQRDILPGLTTLSRHEVTEDLQTFSGLMRASGHTYSRLTRRNSGRNNGGGRGRRKAVVTPSPLQNTSLACNVKAGLEDRSLTGWGKTTRRPRRQRIPAGNLNVVRH